MTPLQELISAIWTLVPGVIPHVFVAWTVTAIAAAIRLGVDEFRGEHRPVTSEVPFFLGSGMLLTIFVLLSAARDKGLIAPDSLAGMLIGSLAITIPFIRAKWRRAG